MTFTFVGFFMFAGLLTILWFRVQKKEKEWVTETQPEEPSLANYRLTRRERRRLRRAAERAIATEAGRSAVRPLPKIAYTDPSSYLASQPEPVSFQNNFSEMDFVASSDDDYSFFTAETWRQATINAGPIPIIVNGEEFKLVSLAPGQHGYPYVNVLAPDGVRKSYAADARHQWSYQYAPFNPSAFLAMMHGVDPIKAITNDDAPETYEEALGMDRVGDGEKRYVIHYENAEGERAWRVVSRVVRDFESFTARCHLRWGARRTFRWDRLLEVIDVKTGEIIPLASFRKSRS